MENKDIHSLAIVGTGIMGMGIAQIAAQANIKVRLYDTNSGAAAKGLEKLTITLQNLVDKNKITKEAMENTLDNLTIIDKMSQVSDVDLIIEAVTENLEIKQKLFCELEDVVGKDVILATNTSSFLVTSIAANCKYPERVAGYHFFNPVPLMKIVEVIAGFSTKKSVVDSLLSLASRMGHLGVVTKDSPGFLINHAGRAFVTEAVKILSESVANTDTIDEILRAGAGFRMGSFELLDMTGLDVSHPVMESIFNQFYQEDRYRPNAITKQMYMGKKFGRKVGEGFYQYEQGKRINLPKFIEIPNIKEFKKVWIGTDFPKDKQILIDFLTKQSITIDQNETPESESLVILGTYGEDATTSAMRFKVNPEQVILIDMLTPFSNHRTLMPSLVTKRNFIDQALALFSKFETSAKLHSSVSLINESVGFVAQRVVSMIINLGCDIAQQQIASPLDIDNAVRIGLGYPYGPITWGDNLGPQKILLILERMQNLTGDQRYRPSPWLQRRAKLKVSLFQENNILTM